MARIKKFWLVIFLSGFLTNSVLGQCYVNAEFSYTSNCQGLATHFSDSTAFNTGNSIVSWSWNFGDGTNAITQHPSHVYASTGTYTVTLTVTTAQGCSDTETKLITIHAPPVATFTINNNPVSCNDEFISYTNNSTGNGITYLWTFGNGSTSQLQTPQHAVPPMPNSCSGFNYSTQLIVTDIYGCTSVSIQNAIVQPRPTAEIVSASDYICAISVNGQYEAEHTIFNMSTAPCTESLLIDWGDGTPLESGDIFTIDFTHIYINPGLISATVYGISNSGACTTVVFRDTVLIEITPTAGIIGPTASWINGCVPFTTYFILNSDVTPTTTQQVIWGGMDTVNLPSSISKSDTVWHTFTVSGCDSLGNMTPYNVILKAQNQCGSSFTSWGDFAVHRPPIANFTVPDTICKNDFITFTNTTNRNLCGGWTLTQFNWRVYKNGVLIINQNSLVQDASSTLPDFSFTFQDTGTYNIVLTATDNGTYGCGSTQFSKTIYVQGTFANFWTDTICLGNPTSFYDSSYSVNGYLTSWYWDFGDGTNSNDTNTYHVYATPGFQNVTHIVFDSNNCSDTIVKQAYVSPYPVSQFNFDTVCVGAPTTFTDMSFTTAIDSIVYWEWWFGDGDTTYTQNPIHSYQTEGFYDVTLIVNTTLACPDTLTQSVYVSPLPTASFISDSVCFGQPTNFTDLSFTSAIDSIIFWEWDFGDGTVVNDTNPTHIFLTEGFHDVTLVIGSSIGCFDTIVNQAYVSPPPTAYFYFDTVCLGYPVHFIDSSLSNSLVNITGWMWTFGDGDTTYAVSPNHLYSDTGYFNVTLYVATQLGCMDSITQSIYVNPYPIVNFSSTTVCLGTATQFTDQTTTSPIDHIVSWNWNFGGGATSNLQNPQHTFGSAGNHSVTLHTVSAVGCEETVTHNAYVSPFPVANFSAPAACIGSANNFINQSTTSGIHPINQWYWTFGDGATATSQSPNHTYADTGIYNVSLVVASSLNCVSDTIHKTTYVSPYPNANFTFDTVCLTHSTSFTDLSSTIANDSIISWQWSFGDGGISNLQHPQHVYPDSGHFVVTLIAGSSIGCHDTITKTIYVKPLPFVDFSLSNVCLGNPNTFTDLSTYAPVGQIISWQWFFGDAATSNQQNASHTYADTGIYEVTLIAISDIGCSDSIKKMVYVSPYPLALFTIDSVCLNNQTTISEMSYTLAQDSIINWQWDFDDGNLSVVQNPAYTYSDTGHFNISLTVSTSIGCNDTLIQTTYISPYPVANFSADTACFGNPTHFNNVSYTNAIDTIISWQWDFGDGQFSNNQNPVHLYNDSGFFDVVLIVTSLYGCGDTIQKSVYVKPLPTPDFSATTECFGFTTSFTDLSYSSIVDTISNWHWQFGDGNTSAIQNPTHIYADSGYYNVTLVVSSSIGCSDSISNLVYVSPAPVANFVSDTVCLNNTTLFSDISYTLANDNITEWHWDFGDGNISNLQSPTHIYSDTGFYIVSLVVNTSIGCTDTIEKNAYVSPYPVADFSADTACLTWPTSFTDLSSTPAIDSIISWVWDFGDGNTSLLQNPQHIYADSGNYTVSLVVTSYFGCNDTVTKTIYVNAPPEANFTATTVCLGYQTSFNDLSSASVYDYITQWVWDFGDGNYASTQHPTHIYSDSGLYNTTLIVNSWLGCSDTFSLQVYVSPYPVAGFDSDTVCLGNMTSFYDLSYTQANDSIISWLWDFGNGNTSTLQNPSHIYSDTGFYQVNLIIATSIGCTDTIEKNAYVSPYPVADFSADTACLTWPTGFTNLSSTPAIDSIISWVWDFGDGNTSLLQNPQHIYADSGNYTVSLVVTSYFGCADTVTKNIYVKPLPIPDFSAPNVCIGTATQYSDFSFGSPVDTVNLWQWHFGDGQTSITQNPTHLFADSGLYTTTLIVSTSINCSDSISKQVYVSPMPVANFEFDTVCIGNSTLFTGLSYTLANDTLSSWLWQFGDSSEDTVENATHVYSDTGYYQVNLLVISSMGCADSISKPVFVSPSPVADFHADSACFGFETVFTDLSYSLAFDTVIAWEWDFGDGNFSSLQHPVHLYADTGIYQVTLTCYSQIGCSNTISKDIYVKPRPYPDFNSISVCLGQQMQFTDLTQAADNDTISAWLWHFENQTSTLQHPSHLFSDTGIFSVSLIAYGMLGCTDTITKNVYVSPYPIAEFSFDTICMGYPTHFIDESFVLNNDSITMWLWDFGDGNSSTLQNPQHIYADSGFYNVLLTIGTSIGCSDTISHQVYVSPSPIADFSTTSVCLGNTSTFTDLSYTYAIDTILSWTWNFGDGNTSTLQNPQHVYSDTGVYMVSLQIESTIGCPHQISKNVYVSPYPEALFSADTVCIGSMTIFTDSSFTYAADNLQIWNWTFGNGQSSSLQNPTHTYNAEGFYTVNLLVTSGIGCADSIQKSVYVSPMPLALFTADTACLGVPTVFTDLSVTTAIDSIIYHEWDFGDGNTSFMQNPTHTYASSGFYNVTLVVGSTFGCTDTVTSVIYVSPLPQAIFYTDTVCIGTGTSFTNQSLTTAIDSLVGYSWNFGDGHTSNGVHPTHLYTDTGFYDVSLSIVSALGCSDSIVHDVYVSAMPFADFVADTACFGTFTQFNDISYTLAQDSITAWIWDFGSGNTSVIQNPAYIFSDTGHFQVSLISVTSIGCADTVIKSVYISPYPVADFIADTACQGGVTSFTDLSFTPAIDSITTWQWDFGDGNTSSVQHPVHTYTSSGVFTVTLIVQSYLGCADTIQKNAYVSPPPVIVFNTDSACFGFENSFTDLTNIILPDSAISWLWDYGDGNTSDLQHPQHLYTDTGHFTVNLTIETAIGCVNNASGDAYVKPLPYPNFEALPACYGYPVFFNDISVTAPNDAILTWDWDFGDGNSSTLQHPSHAYSDTGTYQVTLITGSILGCFDSIQYNVHVIPLPSVDFNAMPVCFGQSTIFEDLTESHSYLITDWLWLFGDGDSSVIQNPAHIYSQPGIYTVTLIVTNEYGCLDSTSRQVTVYDLPLADFDFSNVCLNEVSAYNDLSVYVTNTLTTWQWDFGDGNNATTQNPTHTYTNHGGYDVMLIVTDSVGCTDSVVNSITIYPLPVADFFADSICSGDSAYFADISTTLSGTIDTWQWNFGDGLGTSVIQNPVYLYNNTNNIIDFNVTLIVSNSHGCYDTITQVLRDNPLPVAQFLFDTACFGNATQFTDVSYSNGGAINSWEWDFGDNSGTSTLQSPDYMYNTTGFFNVSLIVTDVKSCSSSLDQLVLVDSLPIPSFDWCQVCLNGQLLPVTFTNTSQGNGSTIVQNQWDFGNGQSSAQATNVTGNYTMGGNYDATLVVTNNRGCIDSITETIHVHSGLSVNFTYQVNCFDVSFYATSNNATSLIEWEWNFGDGTYGHTHDSATHTYFQPGTYQITLTVYDSLPCLNMTCSQSVTNYIYVYPPPVANFSAPNVLVGQTTDFTDLSTAPLSSVVTWAWDFGDGNTSNQQHPSHTYGQFGIYDVTLVITNSYGCSETITQQVIVYPALTADFDGDTICAQTPLTINNTSQVLLPGVPVLWFWDFGDGNTSTDSLPTHIYNAPGIYTVMLIVSMSPAVADTAYGIIKVIESPIADFLFTEVCWGDTLTVLTNNSFSSHPISQIRWNLGDGTLSTLGVVHHNYPQYGNYQVLLIVQNNYGCMDSIMKTVQVFDKPLVVFEGEPKAGCQPLEISFNDSSTVNNAVINNWLWNFGDGLGSVGYPNINHLYNTHGIFNVTLTVTTNQGCANSITYPNYIHVYPKPNADFTHTPSLAFTTDMVYFENNSIGSTSWYWDFGDGNNSISFNPYHIFFEGFNEVTLIAYNEYNCTDTAYKTIHIKETTLLYVPNAFSPLNKDGLNDFFMVSATNIENLEMRIFNRYGEMIFYTDDINKGWDGKHEGRIVPLGVYVWKIWYRDAYGYEQEKYGSVTVVY